MSTENHPPLAQNDESKEEAQNDESKEDDQPPSVEMSEIQDFVSPAPLPSQTLPEPSFSASPQQQNNHQLAINTDGQTPNQTPKLTPEQEQALIRYNHISYLLYLLSFLTAGLTWIIPIFMNYYKRREADGTWLATHFDWQIKTFWYSIILGVVSIFLLFFGLGGLGISVFAESGSLAIGSSMMFFLAGFLFLVNILWHLYRIVRGWIALSDGRPV